MLGQNPYSVVNQFKPLETRITIDRVVDNPWFTDVHRKTAISSSKRKTQSTDLEERSWIFHEIFDHYHKNDGQLEDPSICGLRYKDTWKLCKNLPERASIKYSACMRRKMSDRNNWWSKESFQDNGSKKYLQVPASKTARQFRLLWIPL